MQTGKTVGLYEESHALVIGVSDYTNGWPKLLGVLNKDRFVTGAELGEFLFNNVVNYSKGTQHPQY